MRTRLVDVRLIVQSRTTRPEVGDTQADISWDLAFDREIELPDRSVIGIERITGYRLRGYCRQIQTSWKRIWEGEQGAYARLVDIRIGLGDTERPTLVRPIADTEALGELCVSAANDGLG